MRWNRIAREASEQSRRARLPEIAAAVALADALTIEAGYRYMLEEAQGFPNPRRWWRRCRRRGWLGTGWRCAGSGRRLDRSRAPMDRRRRLVRGFSRAGDPARRNGGHRRPRDHNAAWAPGSAEKPFHDISIADSSAPVVLKTENLCRFAGIRVLFRDSLLPPDQWQKEEFRTMTKLSIAIAFLIVAVAAGGRNANKPVAPQATPSRFSDADLSPLLLGSNIRPDS